MALGRSQTEMRTQILSKPLGAKAEIPPGRRLESRQIPPCQGLCPGFPLTLKQAVENTLLYNFCFSASPSRKYSAPRQQQSCSLSCSFVSPQIPQDGNRKVHPSKTTRNFKITPHLHLRPMSLLSFPDTGQHCQHLSRCFQSPALCDAGTPASAPPAPLAQAAFVPHHEQSPFRPPGHTVPAVGPLPGSERRCRHRPAADTAPCQHGSNPPALSWAGTAPGQHSRTQTHGPPEGSLSPYSHTQPTCAPESREEEKLTQAGEICPC